MVVALFVFLLLAAYVLWLASPIPGNPLFIIALFSLYVLPYRQSLAIVLCAAFLADFFSPVKGIMTVTYTLGFLGAQFLSGHVLAYRTFLGCMILVVGMSIVVTIIQIVLFGAFDIFVFGNGAEAGARFLSAFVKHIPWFIISIPTTVLFYSLIRFANARTAA